MSGMPISSEIRDAYTHETLSPPTVSESRTVADLCRAHAVDDAEALLFMDMLGLRFGLGAELADADRRAAVRYHTATRVTGRRIG